MVLQGQRPGDSGAPGAPVSMTGRKGRPAKIRPAAWNLHGPQPPAAGPAVPFLRLPAAISPTPHADEGHRRSGEMPPFPAIAGRFYLNLTRLCPFGLTNGPPLAGKITQSNRLLKSIGLYSVPFPLGKPSLVRYKFTNKQSAQRSALPCCLCRVLPHAAFVPPLPHASEQDRST